MRNPNGYGAIINLGKGRRKPYAVRLTVDYELNIVDGIPHTKQKYKYLGYYKTRKEAMLALADYNINPLDLTDMTFAEVYNKWFKSRFGDGNKTAVYYSYTAAYKKCAAIADMKLKDIRTAHFQQLLKADMSKSTISNIYIVCRYVVDWGLKNDIINKDYLQYVEKPNVKSTDIHKIFTKEEIEILWNNKDNYYIDVTLMLIYSGMRSGEFFNLTPDDIDLKKRCISIRQAKTAAGVRIVPIADKTLPMWQNWQQLNCSMQTFKSQWKNVLKKLNMEHLLHDTRHTFVSLMTAAGVSLPIVQKIVGHSSNNVTENVYLHVELDTLLNEINKI